MLALLKRANQEDRHFKRQFQLSKSEMMVVWTSVEPAELVEMTSYILNVESKGFLVISDVRSEKGNN